MSKSQVILLTGATGFIGSHLLESLLDKDYQIIILKRQNSDVSRIASLLNSVISYDIDVTPLKEIFEENKIDYVLHLATLYRKFNNGVDIKEMVESNVTFPVELVELSSKYSVKGFINTGTFFEYDCSKNPVSENALIKPFNFYAKTKIAFEAILGTYSTHLNIHTLRLFSPYGEKDNDKLIPMIIKKSLTGESIQLSDGLQKLDFVYVADIVNAYLKSISHMQANNQSGYKVFNIGSGLAVSIREVVSIIEQQLGREVEKQWGEPSEMDIPIAFADIGYADSELGWTPKHSIHDGIAKTIEYYKKGILL